MDCHGAGEGFTFNSLIAEDLDPAREFVVQEEWTATRPSWRRAATPRSSWACTRYGTRDGVLNHTVSGMQWQNLWFNGTLGRDGINAALCGAWDCPVLLVTGDDAVCAESTALLGDGLTTVSVKQGLGLRSARMLVPSARELIEEGARKALST